MGILYNNVTVFFFMGYLDWPRALDYVHGKPFQGTINLETRFGNKIHPTFKNYLLNFNHSGFMTTYLHDKSWGLS